MAEFVLGGDSDTPRVSFPPVPPPPETGDLPVERATKRREGQYGGPAL
jgi:hypothetical protein